MLLFSNLKFYQMAQKIHIDKIEEGQILGETLSNKFGQVLINKGTILNLSSHIRILKMWGIDEVEIISDSNDDISTIGNNDLLAEIENALIEKIGWKVENPNEKFLIDIAVFSQYEKGV